MTTSLNKVMLIGRLGRDPEKRYTSSELPVCRFTMATSERIKKGDSFEEKTEWHRIVVFGGQAENIARYLKKGSLVYVEGKIQTRSYTDKDGAQKSSTEIVATSVNFLDSKESVGEASGERVYESAPNASAKGDNSKAPDFDDDDHDLPF
ncbi:single-stranded DNA-binding protein [bacterium]|nr:single-stranded DNA-binding protein [bacterium]